MKELPYLMTFIFLTTISFSQKRTYLGIETAITNDNYEIIEYGNQLLQTPLIGGRLGVTVRQDLNNYLSAEVGFTFKRYKEGFGFKTINGSSSSSAFGAYCFPLRLYTRINLFKERIFVTPVLGLVYCYSPYADSDGNSSGKFKSMKDSVTYYTYTSYGPTKHFILMQTGLSLDFSFTNNSSLSIFTSYYTGFTKIFKTNITYQVNDKPFVNGQAFSKGSFWDVIGISYKYPISKMWQKSTKDQKSN